jgi:hypothetical protein
MLKEAGAEDKCNFRGLLPQGIIQIGIRLCYYEDKTYQTLEGGQGLGLDSPFLSGV